LHEHPERAPFTYLTPRMDGGFVEQPLTYRVLSSLAARWVDAMLAHGFERGDRVLLCFGPGLEFIVGFWGCVMAGLVPVPAYAPSAGRTIDRILGIARDCRPRFALTTVTALEALPPELARPELGVVWQGVDWPAAPALGDTEAAAVPGPAQLWPDVQSDAHTLAFLQYTSGSIGTPRGVMITHGNALANLAYIQRTYGSRMPRSASVGCHCFTTWA
jgi:acyl-CoA synthetase (AMP-forming)/AMP-acid ligase II